MKEKEIEACDFLRMFVAISYSSEQVFFNFVDLTGYLFGRYVVEEDVYNQLEDALDNMIDDGKITKVEGCDNLYHINHNYDYIRTIKENREYLNDMIHFFKSYYDRSNKLANIRIVENKIEVIK